MQSGTGSAIAAIFPDHASAEACLHELQQNGFGSPWLAITKASAGDAMAERYGTNAGSVEHDVAASSDGMLGTIGRFFSGEVTLRRSLMDHGIAETTAHAIDAAVPQDGAVIVVAVDKRADAATSIFAAHGGDVHGVSSSFVSSPAPRTEASGRETFYERPGGAPRA